MNLLFDRRYRYLIFFLCGFFAGFSFVPFISLAAAPLTWTNPTTVNIISPSAIFTIASGSVADSLVVNATSVVVDLSSSTGGAFTLMSGDSDLVIASSSGGGTAPTSCISGSASTTITQLIGSAIYTVTPTGVACSGGSGGSLGNTTTTPGSVIGVAASYAPPTIPSIVVNPSNTTITDIASLMTMITSLKSKLQSLLAEAQQRGIAISWTNTASVSGKPYVFSRNLSLWATGADVKALQEFLINKHTGPAGQKLASHGTTQTFGNLTFDALVEYQHSVGLPATGFFGPMTRTKINIMQ